MSNFNFKVSDFNDPSKIAERISGPGSTRNLKTSRAAHNKTGDPLDVTLFSMSQILLGLPAMKSSEEILATIQSQVFSGINVISGALDALGLSDILPSGVKEVTDSLSPDAGAGQPFSLYGPDGSVPPYTQYNAAAQQSISKVWAIANAEVGNREDPPGTDRQKYAEIAGVPNGEKWCATFLMAVFKQAGMDQGNLLTPSTVNTVANYEKVQRVGNNPVPGALCFFAFGGGRINHVGLVVKVLPGNKLMTIEGNTTNTGTAGGNQRDGGYVALKSRNMDMVVKYAYPVYAGEAGIAPLPTGGGAGFNPGAPPTSGASGGGGTSYRWHPAQSATVDAKGPRPGASALMEVVLEKFPGTSTLGIYNYRQIRGGSSLSVHSEGRALDIGVPVTDAGRALGDRVFALLAPAAWQLGLQRIVWYRRIWQASNPSGKAYGGSHPHYDHLHVEMTREASTNLTRQQIESIFASFTSGQSFNIPEGA